MTVRQRTQNPAGARRSISQGGLGLAFAVLCVDGAGYALCLPFLPFAIAKLGGEAHDYAFAVAGYGVARLASVPFTGYLSDRVRPELLALQTCALGAVAGIVAGLAPSVAMLFCALAAFGIASGRGSPLRLLALRDIDRSRESAALSRLSAAGPLGFSIGPLLALAVTFGTSDALMRIQTCMLAIGTANLVLMTVFAQRLVCGIRAAASPSSGPADPIRGRQLLNPLITAATAGFVQALLVTNLSLFVSERLGWGADRIAITLGCWALLATLSRLILAPGLLLRAPPRTVSTLAALAGMAGFAALGPATGVLAIMTALSITFLSISLLTTLPAVVANQTTARDRRGAAFGLIQTGSAIGTIAGASAVGLIVSGADVGAPFRLAAVVLGLQLGFEQCRESGAKPTRHGFRSGDSG